MHDAARLRVSPARRRTSASRTTSKALRRRIAARRAIRNVDRPRKSAADAGDCRVLDPSGIHHRRWKTKNTPPVGAPGPNVSSEINT